MRPGTASRARQILLLCALTLSVLGMHHVALPPPGAGHSAMAAESKPTMAIPAAESTAQMAAPSDDSGDGMGHDLLHLCLVVLSAAAVFLLTTWLLAAVGTARSSPGKQRRSSVPRRPTAAGRSLLASVCVLRL